jgi:hypothetical protein
VSVRRKCSNEIRVKLLPFIYKCKADCFVAMLLLPVLSLVDVSNDQVAARNAILKF